MNKNIFKDYIIVISIVSSVFASVMGTSMLLLCYPSMMDFFGLGLKEFHLRTFLFFCFFSVSLPFCGVMTQKIGARLQFFLGIGIFLISALGSALSTSWYVFLFFQILQAFADGMMVSTMTILIRIIIPENRLGWAFGLQSAILSTSGFLGPPLGSIISSFWGWQSVFYFLFCVSFCSFFTAFLIIPKFKEDIKKDLPLPYLNVIALFLLFLSIHWVINADFFKIIPLLALFSSISLFLHTESHNNTCHLFPQGILKNRAFLMCIFFIFCIATANNLFFFFAPGYLQGYLQFSPANLSWIITIEAAVPLLLATYFGKLSDRFPYLILMLGISSYFSAMVLFSFFYLVITLWILAALYTIIGLANALLSPSQMKLTIMSIPKSLTGPYMGTYYFVQFSSGSIAAIIFTAIKPKDTSLLLPEDFYYIIIFCGIIMLSLFCLSLIRIYNSFWGLYPGIPKK